MLFGTLAFIFVSFAVQALSHFAINEEHYSGITFMREEPIMALGVFTMIIQGMILTYLYRSTPKPGNPILQGLKFGLLMGVFFVSYIALVEPSKYMAPSILSWFLVEGTAGLIQFGMFGILLGIIYRSASKA
jgi:hypothetical protein